MFERTKKIEAHQRQAGYSHPFMQLGERQCEANFIYHSPNAIMSRERLIGLTYLYCVPHECLRCSCSIASATVAGFRYLQAIFGTQLGIQTVHILQIECVILLEQAVILSYSLCSKIGSSRVRATVTGFISCATSVCVQLNPSSDVNSSTCIFRFCRVSMSHSVDI
jgi:hypothetical protein